MMLDKTPEPDAPDNSENDENDSSDEFKNFENAVRQILRTPPDEAKRIREKYPDEGEEEAS